MANSCPYCGRGRGAGCEPYEKKWGEGAEPRGIPKSSWACRWAATDFREVTPLEGAMLRVKMEDERGQQE